MPVFDLLLKGGTLIDGQRTPRFTGDVAIAGGELRRLGRCPSPTRNAYSTRGI